jgi:hypothetical protein
MHPMRTLAWRLSPVLFVVAWIAACGAGSKQPGFGADSGTQQLSPDSGGETADTGPTLGGGMDSGMSAPPPPTGPLSLEACAACKAAGGTCSSTTCTISENPGMVPAATQTQLTTGGTADPRFVWLYPYDQTIFPRGLLAPTLQFDGNPPDALYVEAVGSGFSYKGFYGSSNPGRAAISQNVWEALTLSTTSPVKVSVTKISGGAVSGPITESWGVAHGSLKGTIFYETYGSTIAGGLGSVAIMHIQPGATQPTVFKSGCANVCHTASADGSTLVSATGFIIGSVSYDLKNNGAVMNTEADNRFVYGGLYPDGSFAMSATNYRTWLPGARSALYDTKTGLEIAAPGWDGVVTNGGTTSFSPDGKWFSFIHEDKDQGAGHTLSLMSFAVATQDGGGSVGGSFSGLTDLVTNNNATLGWPAFTPDSQWVVYHAGSNAGFETDQGATGDVYAVNKMTKTVHRLDALDGYTGSGSASYLPAMDPGLSFAPTVLPEAVGGYFWVVFTSHRSYGNMLPSMASAGGGSGVMNTDDAGVSGDDLGKLWVAAMDIPESGGEFPTMVTDPSHPAFYLDGQELSADNLRGFWVLNPCKADGTSCATGDDCCGGYCYGTDAGMGSCSSKATGCSAEYDKCTTTSDCCDQTEQCIGGRCAQTTPQ